MQGKEEERSSVLGKQHELLIEFNQKHDRTKQVREAGHLVADAQHCFL